MSHILLLLSKIKRVCHSSHIVIKKTHLKDIVIPSIVVPMLSLRMILDTELQPAPYRQAAANHQIEAELVRVPLGSVLHVLTASLCHRDPVIHCPLHCH